MRRRALLLGLVSALAAGCDTAPPSAVGGNCTSAATDMCLYVEAASNPYVTQATCIAILGPSFVFFEGAPCPVERSVGGCALVEPDAMFLLQYYAPGFTQEEAAADCASRDGTFQPPPAPVLVR